jgi:hypothetical protein
MGEALPEVALRSCLRLLRTVAADPAAATKAPNTLRVHMQNRAVLLR